MSKTIKLDEDVYKELEKFLLPRETFSQAVFRLLSINKQLNMMLRSLAGEKPEIKERR